MKSGGGSCYRFCNVTAKVNFHAHWERHFEQHIKVHLRIHFEQHGEVGVANLGHAFGVMGQ